MVESAPPRMLDEGHAHGRTAGPQNRGARTFEPVMLNSPDASTIECWSAIAYEAASDANAWPRLMQELVKTTGASGGAIFTPVDDAMGRRLGARTGSVTAESFAEYMAHWRRFDPWNLSPAAPALFARAGSVRHGHEFIADDAFVRTAYYNDFSLRHSGGGLLSLRVCDAQDPHAPEVNLTLLRPFRMGPFPATVHKALRRFWPELRAAVRAHWSLGPVRHAQAVASDVLQLLPMPAWLLREDGTVLCMNAPADSLHRSGSRALLLGHRLHRVWDLPAERLLAALKDALLGIGAELPLSLGAHHATLRVLPVGQSHELLCAWPHARALVLLETVPVREASHLERLAAEHGLTPREREVLGRLAAGKSVTAIAEELEISRATVRTYLQGLFEKTGCRRQAALVRLVLAAR